MKKGFTLVELSIVLVIIGLLVGGILVAQSLIDSARINKLVRDLGQFEAAAQLFKANYRTYPGNSSYFSPPGSPNGTLGFGDTDGDGEADAVNCNGALSNFEQTQAFAHMSQAGMIDEDYEAFSPETTCTGGTHATAYGDNADIVAPYTDISGSGAVGYNSDEVPISASKSAANHNFGFQITLSPIDSLAIEGKLGPAHYNAGQPGLFNTQGGAGLCEDHTLFSYETCISVIENDNGGVGLYTYNSDYSN